MRDRVAIVVLLLAGAAGCVATRPPGTTLRETFREGAGRTVVMLGGGVYGAAMFAPHARELSTEFDVIRVQTLNVQRAESGGRMPSDYSISSEATAIHRTLQDIGVSGPIDLVGSSLGAVVALRFATLYPERVRTLVLFEPPAFWVLSDEEFEHDPTLAEMRRLTSGMRPSAAPSDQDLFRFRCLLGACPAAIPAANDPARADWDLSRRAMSGLSAVAAHREDPDAVRRLTAPVLLLNGTQTVRFHRRINESLARILPNVETAEIPGTHAAPRTAQAEFVERTRQFLDRH